MAVGFLNPNDTAHTTATRPAVVRPGINERRWFSDDLNTEVRDHDLNDILAAIRYVIDYYSISDVEGDDSLLLQAIQAGAASLFGNVAALQEVVGGADKVPYWTSSTVMAAFTASPYSRGLLAQTSLAQWQSSLGISAASSPNVVALSGLTGGADQLPYFDGFGSMAQTAFTATARTLLDDTTIAGMRTTLGLGSMALETATTYMPKAGGLFTGHIGGGGPAAIWAHYLNTVDGADSGALVLTGGGAAGADATRGAYIALYGNEHVSNPGQAVFSAVGFAFSGPITSNLKVGGAGTSFTITQNTVDGVDSGALILSGGGAAPDASRGAYLSLFGNEVAVVGGQASLVGPSGVNISSGSGTVAVTGPMTISGSLVLSSSFLPALNTQSVAYSFATLDAGKVVRHNSASSHAYTINPEATTAFSVGGSVGVMSVGAGNVTLTRGGGVVLRGADGLDANYVVGAGQYVDLYKIDNDTWKLPMGLSDQRLFGNVSGAPAVATGLTAAQVKTMLAIGTSDVTGLSGALALKADLAGASFTGSVIFAAAPTVGGNPLFHAGNDGSGSGFDADLLDAQEGTYYRARANHTGTQAPASILMAATSRVVGRITAGGGVAEELTGANLATIIGLAAIALSGSASDLVAGVVPNARISGAYSGFGQITTSGDLVMTAATALIRSATADGSDNQTTIITGGGSSGSDRGASLQVWGNEHATQAGRLLLQAGDTATQALFIGGSAAAASVIIRNNTPDAADSGVVALAAGGAITDTTRGAYVNIYGNEHTTQAGNLLLNAGLSGVVKINGNTVGTAAFANTGTSGATVPLLNAANTFSAAQVISTGVAGAASLTVVNTDAGAAAGPLLDLYRDSASPAANDLIGILRFTGRSSTAAQRVYASIAANIVSPLNTFESAQITFLSTNGLGTSTMAFGPGLTVGSPPGGDQGDGTINATLYHLGQILGTAALATIGTGGTSVPLLDAANTWSTTQTFNSNINLSAPTAGILQTTADGFDNASIAVGGGGGITTARGALINAYGNEHATLPGRLLLQAGDTAAQMLLVGGAAAATSLIIRNNTPDGADSGVVAIAGGGAITDTARGAYVNVYGNEHSTQPGHILLSPGSVGGGVKISGNVYLTVAGQNNIFGAASAATSLRIGNTTPDGSDSGDLQLYGGGNNSDAARGAYLNLYGNEHATQGGNLLLQSGSAGQVKIVGASVFTSTATFLATTAGTSGISIQNTDAGAAAGPVLDMFRDSASPAANDLMSYITFRGRSSTAVARTYADMYIQILDPTNASEDAAWIFRCMVNGALNGQMTLASGLFMAGTVDKGVGSINAATIYINGKAVVGGNVVSKTASYTATLDDTMISFDTTSGACTLNLPAASTAAGKVYIVIFAGGGNTLTIDPAGAELINGAATATKSIIGQVLLSCNGTAWFTGA